MVVVRKGDRVVIDLTRFEAACLVRQSPLPSFNRYEATGPDRIHGSEANRFRTKLAIAIRRTGILKAASNWTDK